MIQKTTKVETFITKAICPNCGKELQISDMVLTTHPCQYQYFCVKCGFSSRSFEQFPKVSYIKVEEEKKEE